MEKIIKSLPTTSGIYQMINKDEKIIYIGKAINIRKRVRSYFQKNKNHSPWTIKMIENIANIKFISTNSEVEALILETNLIKENRPKYNILMKDDKNYVFLKITEQEDYPRLEIVRQRLNDKAKYFGPKTSSSQLRNSLKFISKIFPYRSCRLDIKVLNKSTNGQGDKEGVQIKGKDRKIPCLDYHIKRCSGPCLNQISSLDYKKNIKLIIQFLNGEHQIIKKNLQTQMIEYAQKNQFERAGKIRDLIQSIEKIEIKQLATDNLSSNRDIIGFTRIDKQGFFSLFQIRDGKIINQEQFILNVDQHDISSIFKTFLLNYYQLTTSYPKEIVLSQKITDQTLISDWLNKLTTHKIKIIIPQKGKKERLLSLATKNAQLYAEKNKAKWEKEDNLSDNLIKLAKLLNISYKLKRIECFDISHLNGQETVGSMVVMINGQITPNQYRKFKVKTLSKDKIDDYASLAEVLKRRLSKLPPPLDYQIKSAKKDNLKYITKILVKKGLNNADIKYQQFLIAEKKSKIIGFARINKEKDNSLILRDLWVKDKIHGKKIAYEIMKQLLRRKLGKTVYLLINKQMIPYYQEFGFQVAIGKIPTEVIIKKKKPELVYNDKITDINILKIKVPKEKDSFEEIPNLLVIDGGKGQLNAVNKILQELKLKIPVIGLAKKFEEIFVLGTKKSIKLEHTNPVLRILVKLRDEAHRFAITFHQNLRQKKQIKSKLDLIKGLGPKNKKKLLQEFGSVTGIRRAGLERIAEIVGKKLAEKIVEYC